MEQSITTACSSAGAASTRSLIRAGCDRHKVDQPPNCGPPARREGRRRRISVPIDQNALRWLPPKHDDSWARGLGNQHPNEPAAARSRPKASIAIRNSGRDASRNRRKSSIRTRCEAAITRPANDEGRKRQPGDQVEAHALPRVRRIQWDAGKPGKPVSCGFSLMPLALLTHVYWPRPIF